MVDIDGVFSIVAIDGDWTQFLDEPEIRYLRFDGLTWTRTVGLLDFCFEQGFACVVMRAENKEGNTIE